MRDGIAAAAENLVGRDDEVRVLRGLVADLLGGRGRAVWVEGEPGIGKSALLAAGLADAEGQGCRVLWGLADELIQPLPLGVLLECLEIGPGVVDPARAEIEALLRGEGASGLTPSEVLSVVV